MFGSGISDFWIFQIFTYKICLGILYFGLVLGISKSDLVV